MGVSIDLHIYNRDALVDDIHNYVIDNGGYREGAHRADSFLEVVGSEFGILTPTQFFVVWNEYYEEYNPGSNFLSAVTRYYFPRGDQDDTFWSSSYEIDEGGKTSDDVLEKIFPHEFGWENGIFTKDED